MGELTSYTVNSRMTHDNALSHKKPDWYLVGLLMLGACGPDAERDNPLDPELTPLVPVWQAFTAQDGLAHNYVYSVYQSSDGAMWFGTIGDEPRGGVSRYDATAQFGGE